MKISLITAFIAIAAIYLLTGCYPSAVIDVEVTVTLPIGFP